ncbi:MAG: serine/threonine-protein phosphatase [Polyangiaceae bacterium]|nr:serine/threonine-protein phosphatase [Polyangiaceae bacterium]
MAPPRPASASQPGRETLPTLPTLPSVATKSTRPPPLPDRPLPRVASLQAPRPWSGDEDMDDDITLVGQMSEDIKALRLGYRKVKPEAVDARGAAPDIEIVNEQELDALLVEELYDDAPHAGGALIALEACGETDVGRRREVNEDAILLLPASQSFAVADGMGGHSAGEVASRVALEVLSKALRNGQFEGEPHVLWPRKGDELARSVEAANREVYRRSTLNLDLQGMGTTLTAVRFSLERQRVYIAHVGDSPCFRLRGAEIVQLTRDHTMANLIGATGPLGARLSRAVGVESSVEVDLGVDVPEPGDHYLLCSDGLTKMLKPPEIAAAFATERDLRKIVRALIDRANERGGKDNIAVIVVRIARAPGATGRRPDR